jgi:hypothetical protein
MDQIVITIEAIETLQQKRARLLADMENNERWIMEDIDNVSQTRLRWYFRQKAALAELDRMIAEQE